MKKKGKKNGGANPYKIYGSVQMDSLAFLKTKNASI